jgi:hypothetical protein
VALAAALQDAGVLEAGEATIAPEGGGSLRIAGYRMVDPVRLAAVSDPTFIEWRRRNWLIPLYAHLFSTAKWVAFTELVIAELNARR